MADWFQLSFMDGASPIMEELIYFHDHTMLVLFGLVAFILYLIFSQFLNSFFNQSLYESYRLEVVWSLMPGLMLVFIALPSLRILYQMEELGEPGFSVKVVGHQWYWSYEYTDMLEIEYDSYMVNEGGGNFRVLDVDNRLVFPLGVGVRLLISSMDVLHSWTIPSFGVKVDAVPGRINQILMVPSRLGLYYGQCSEICGSNHSFMPIVAEVTSLGYFLGFLLKG